MGGIIQFYEMAFELAWKLMKDYLSDLGFDIKSPRAAIKQAFQSEIITDGHTWIDALEDRNLTTHTYDEEVAKLVIEKIRNNYYQLLNSLYEEMKRLKKL